MLSRVLEPEVMDSAEEAHDYDTMDHSLVNRAFVVDFRRFWDGQGPVLDVGTGTAQIPIELCRQVPAAVVLAVEVAEHMLARARLNVAEAGLGDRVRLHQADAKNLPFEHGTFPAVVANSIHHHIPEPMTVLAEMCRVAQPGGLLFVRDLLRPGDRHVLEQLVAAYAGDGNAHQQQMFADSLRAALTLAEIRELVGRLHFDPEGVRQTSDRHWTWQAHAAR